jgi:hypothetical protein
MDMFKIATSAMKDKSSPPPLESANNPAPRPSFPQFSSLPQELRLKIWDFALEPRILRLHLHVERPSPWEDQIPEPEEEEDVDMPLDPRWHPQYMIIPSCNGSVACECKTLSVSSQGILPRPRIIYACHESRDFAIGRYLKCLDDEYDSRGHVVEKPLSSLVKAPMDSFPRTGIIFNSEIDAILLSVNLGSSEEVGEIHQFTSIAAQQISRLP